MPDWECSFRLTHGSEGNVKLCKTCGHEKPRTEFSPDKKSADGLDYRCKFCNCKRALSYHAANRDSVNAKAKERSRKYREAHPEHMEMYRQRNKDSLKMNADKYRAENREKIKARYDVWRKANPDKAIAATLAWQAANRDRVNATAMRRKAARLRAVPKWANEEKMREFYDFAVWLSDVIGEPYHVDHAVPLRGNTVCGLHCEANLQILHYRENFSKGNRVWPDMP